MRDKTQWICVKSRVTMIQARDVPRSFPLVNSDSAVFSQFVKIILRLWITQRLSLTLQWWSSPSWTLWWRDWWWSPPSSGSGVNMWPGSMKHARLVTWSRWRSSWSRVKAGCRDCRARRCVWGWCGASATTWPVCWAGWCRRRVSIVRRRAWPAVWCAGASEVTWSVSDCCWGMRECHWRSLTKLELLLDKSLRVRRLSRWSSLNKEGINHRVYNFYT